MVKGIQGITDWMNRPQQFFPDQTYAPQTDAEAQAIEQMKAGAGAYPGMVGQFMPGMEAGLQGALGAPQAALGMGLQDVMSNPALTGAAGAIQSRVNRNLQENILPGLTSSYMGLGGIGGTRQGVAEGIAARGTSDVLAENLANMYGNAWSQGLGAETSRYNAGLGAQQGAFGAAPGVLNTMLSQYTQPAAMLGQAGGLERAEEQRALDEEMARFEFSQNEPFNRYSAGMGALMGPGQAFGSVSTTGTQKSRGSPFENFGSLLGAGGAIGSGLFGQGGLLAGGNPYTTPPIYSGGYGQYNNPWTYGGYRG
jgi:hypothetical protein